jgi:hypothetical protein
MDTNTEHRIEQNENTTEESEEESNENKTQEVVDDEVIGVDQHNESSSQDSTMDILLCGDDSIQQSGTKLKEEPNQRLIQKLKDRLDGKHTNDASTGDSAQYKTLLTKPETQRRISLSFDVMRIVVDTLVFSTDRPNVAFVTLLAMCYGVFYLRKALLKKLSCDSRCVQRLRFMILDLAKHKRLDTLITVSRNVLGKACRWSATFEPITLKLGTREYNVRKNVVIGLMSALIKSGIDNELLRLTLVNMKRIRPIIQDAAKDRSIIKLLVQPKNVGIGIMINNEYHVFDGFVDWEEYIKLCIESNSGLTLPVFMSLIHYGAINNHLKMVAIVHALANNNYKMAHTAICILSINQKDLCYKTIIRILSQTCTPHCVQCAKEFLQEAFGTRQRKKRKLNGTTLLPSGSSSPKKQNEDNSSTGAVDIDWNTDDNGRPSTNISIEISNKSVSESSSSSEDEDGDASSSSSGSGNASSALEDEDGGASGTSSDDANAPGG